MISKHLVGEFAGSCFGVSCSIAQQPNWGLNPYAETSSGYNLCVLRALFRVLHSVCSTLGAIGFPLTLENKERPDPNQVPAHSVLLAWPRLARTRSRSEAFVAGIWTSMESIGASAR